VRTVGAERRASRASREARGAKEPKGAREAFKRGKVARRARPEKAAPRIRFGRRSQLLFGVGGLSIAIGYLLLASGSITLAPVLLVVGYCVFFPMGILLKEQREARKGGE
jgi:hypothetical protein